MSKSKGNEEIFTVEDLMRYLSIGKTTAYKLIKTRKIKVIKIGRLYRIPKSSVDEYINSIKQ